MIGRLTVEEYPVGINVSVTVMVQENTISVNTHLLSSSIVLGSAMTPMEFSVFRTSMIGTTIDSLFRVGGRCQRAVSLIVSLLSACPASSRRIEIIVGPS